MHKFAPSLLVVMMAAAPCALAYDINFPEDAVITHGQRFASAVSVNVSGFHEQSLPVDQQTSKRLYHNHLDKYFIAQPGNQLAVNFAYSADWMNGYVYIDTNRDGVFNPETELMTYSNLGGKNSAGQEHNGNQLQPPTFTLPADLAEGAYAIRFKIDWDSADPAGNNSESNSIIQNGGVIIDAGLYIAAPAPDALDCKNCVATITEGTDGSRRIDVTPDPGYEFEGVRLSTGFDVATLSILLPELLRSEAVFPVFNGANTLEIPASALIANNSFFVSAVKAADASAENYAVTNAIALPAGSLPQVSVDGAAIDFTSAGNGYYRASDPINVAIGSEPQALLSFEGGHNVRFLVDINQNGAFTDDVTALVNESMPVKTSGADYTSALTLPSRPGVYRARVTIENGFTADFFLNVYGPQSAVYPMALNGLIFKNENDSKALLPEIIDLGNSLKIHLEATLPGFKTNKVIVRHGQNIFGPELINGNPQWFDYELNLSATGNITIPGRIIYGDIAIYAIYEEQPSSEWTKVWGDEFNSGSMDSQRWGWQPRANSTWNRLVAQTAKGRAEVNTFENGCYNSLAQKTEVAGENASFISGAIYSQGKFSAKYGKFEARIKTTPHTGNFPAFWLMPAYTELADLGLNGWPRDGEIDIWEQIDDQNKAHHTIHSGWTGWKDYCHWEAPKVESPANSGNGYAEAAAWHVYALEWDNDALKFFVDGELRYTYANQHYVEEGSDKYIAKVTWPFDKEFYIILNQSVGNDSWAKWVDEDFNYHTHFDYVRVYQKKDQTSFTSSLSGNGDDPEFFVPAQGIPAIETSVESIAMPEVADGPTMLFDLNGRQISGPAAPGIYIEKHGNYSRKIIVK